MDLVYQICRVVRSVSEHFFLKYHDLDLLFRGNMISCQAHEC